MAEIILENVLNKKISVDHLLNWLTSENPEERILPDFSQTGYAKTDFISYFLNYLREQCKSVLPEIKETQEKPVKTLVQPRPGIIEVKRAKTLTQSSQLSQGVSVASVGPRLPRASEPQPSEPLKQFPPLPHQLNAAPSSPNNPAYGFSAASPSRDLHSQPKSLFKNLNQCNVARYKSQPMSSHSSDDSMIGFAPTAPISPSNVSNVANNQQPTQMVNFNSSYESVVDGVCDLNLSNASMSTSSPIRNENWMRNNSSTINSSYASLSPFSSLDANYSSILVPPKHERSLNATHSTFDDSCSSNASKTSTPKSTGGNGSTNSKSRQNNSFRLEDFMKSESSNKSKKQAKINSAKQSQSAKKTPNETQSKNSQSSNDKQGQRNDKQSKRRIKPTRLNVSSDQESRPKEVFGVINRPTAVNPKFIEVPSTDKSQEELSFEFERSLLKLERQRLPKNETSSEATNVEAKLPNKHKLEATIAPRLDLVENIEILDTLALLHSEIFDRNLIPNPMSELYFMMTLLTTQYKAAGDKKIVTKVPVDKNQSSSAEILETLKNDLGCQELSNENCTETSDCDFKSSDTSFAVGGSAHDKNHSTAESRNKNSKPPAEYLNTAHNCVYFATVVLLHRRCLLTVLDRPTLKLLSENQQIAAFQPQLQTYLNEIYSAKCLQTNRLKPTDSGNCQTNVCFQVDTDNREAFPSTLAFTLFRKQRDLFYDILKDWEDNHLKPDWSYQRALKNKINSLLTQHSDAVNYCRLAKLFISQLLVSCGQSAKMEDPLDDESLSFLKSLKHLNPEKLLQLKERLVTPLSSTGPVPEPTFPGAQDFYKEFILNAQNWKFYVILENSFISEIMERNETQFAQSEIESTETTVEERTKQDFITCVSGLRLLAKFTSFTISLPFKSVANSPEWRLSQIQLRGRVVPSLDLQSCLLDAITEKRLSLTVPWVVQYMAMLDPVTYRLPYFVNIGEILYCIYRISNNSQRSHKKERYSMSRQTSALMIFTIGWLFELPNFPRDLYDNWQRNYNARKIRNLELSSESREKGCKMINMDKEFVKFNSSLDDLDIIDDRAFYECCPFMTELKILLISGNAILSNSNANRHITPVSSQLSEPSSGVKTKNLQMQIEEAFWHGQPSSVKKTVDFIVDRVASSCVKHICNTIIPSTKEKIIKNYIKSKENDFKKIDFIQKDEDPDDKTETSPDASPHASPMKVNREAHTKKMKQHMEFLATTIKDDVRRECSEKMANLCETKTANTLDSLLADDVLPTVRQTCISIAKRTAMERIDQWIDAHIVESLFLKNINSDTKRFLKEDDSNQIFRETHHDKNVPSPTEVVEMIRNSMWELLEKKKRWSVISKQNVLKTLTNLEQTLTTRADLVDYTERNLYTMSVEFCLLLITHAPDLFTQATQDKFLKVWKMNNSRSGGGEPLFAGLISPRNIRLLTLSSNSSVMRVFAQLLKALLRNGLLNIEALSDQCVALFQQDWSEPTLKLFSQCLKDVVADYKCTGAEAQAMKYLLDWIATTCDQMYD